MFQHSWRPVFALALQGFAICLAHAAAFTPGNIVAVRVGDGGAPLSATSTRVFLDEYTPAGALVQSIALPFVSVSGSSRALTLIGNAASEGYLSRSLNKAMLVVGGYDATPGITGTTVLGSSATYNRVICKIGADGAPIIVNALGDAYSGGGTSNFRSVATVDGTAFWMGGNAVASADAGARYAAAGSSTSVRLSSSPTNLVVVRVLDPDGAGPAPPQLYTSCIVSPMVGISTIGAGLPTAPEQTTTLLPGFPGTDTTPSMPEYFFASATRIYASDQRTDGNGGVTRWDLVSGTWTKASYTMSLGGVGVRGLCDGGLDGQGRRIIYGTTTDGRIAKFTDTLNTSYIAQAIATAPTNTTFRGIALAPENANLPPTAQNQNVDTLEDTSANITLVATDPENQALTYSITQQPLHGTISGTAPNVTYTPAANYNGPDTFKFTATDSQGAVSNEATVSITVISVNDRPQLVAPGNQPIDEEQPYNANCSATDPNDNPPNTPYTFSLTNAPNGMTINAATGAITWTPTEQQGPGDYTVTVRVTDSGGTANGGIDFDEATYMLHVNEVNTLPELAPISNQTIDEMAPFTITASATDDDIPQNTLTFSVVTGPAGLTIGASTGIIDWTPTEAQGPGVYSVTIRVTDNGNPPLYDEETFQITVREVNRAPSVDAGIDREIDELTHLQFTVSASDPDEPANTLTFSLQSAPPGMTINSSSGEIDWTPSEAQGPGVFTVTVKVDDNGTPALSATDEFQVTVNEINEPPGLDPIGNFNTTTGNAVTFTATAADPDIPTNTLTFSLSGEPLGAHIDPNTGEFSWIAGAPGVYTFDVIVTDDGDPSLSDSEQISITVAPAQGQTAVVVALEGVHIPIGQTVSRWLHITLGGTGGANQPVEYDVVAEFTDADGNGGAFASASFMLVSPAGAGVNLNRISVKDPLHTLRKTAALAHLGGENYSAQLSLKSGDANDDNVIDILDYVIFALHFGTSVGKDTFIGQGFSGGVLTAPHPDWTCDGLVTTPDYLFVATNYLLVGDMPPGPYAPSNWPRVSVSLKELALRGFSRAAAYDLNRDGVVTTEEVSAWLSRR